MPSAPKSICCGCRAAIVPTGERCVACKAKSKRGDQAYEKRRGSFRTRGYTAEWSKLSVRYRTANPLCTMCASRGVLRPAECVDHIIPLACMPDLVCDWDNLAGSCVRCNSRKRFREPKEPWTRHPGRVVVCGLPGTGKTTYAKSTGLPFFDSDDDPSLTYEAVQQARTRWIASIGPSEPCIVIVASTLTAPHVARQLSGTVKHLTEQYVQRPPHPHWQWES
jgi:5-methylcytosine-specific restriction enzyme A